MFLSAVEIPEYGERIAFFVGIHSVPAPGGLGIVFDCAIGILNLCCPVIRLLGNDPSVVFGSRFAQSCNLQFIRAAWLPCEATDDDKVVAAELRDGRNFFGSEL